MISNFSPLETVSAVIVVMLTLNYVLRGFWQKEWRNETDEDPNRPPPWFPFGRAPWRVQMRLGGVTAPVTLALSTFAVASLLDIRWLALGSSFAFMSFVLLMFSISLFARPKWAIPPHLRQHPGLVQEWLGAPATAPSRELPARPRSTQPRESEPSSRSQVLLAAGLVVLGVSLAVAGALVAESSFSIGGGLMIAGIAAVLEALRELKPLSPGSRGREAGEEIGRIEDATRPAQKVEPRVEPSPSTAQTIIDGCTGRADIEDARRQLHQLASGLQGDKAEVERAEVVVFQLAWMLRGLTRAERSRILEDLHDQQPLVRRCVEAEYQRIDREA